MRSTPAGRGVTVALAVTVAALAVAGLTGCGSSSGALTTAQRFAATVKTAGSGGATVAMASVTHFDWEHGAFVCPSGAVGAVEKAVAPAGPTRRRPTTTARRTRRAGSSERRNSGLTNDSTVVVRGRGLGTSIPGTCGGGC